MNLTHRKEYLFRYVFLTCYSSIENEVIRKILDLFIFFYKKMLNVQKGESNQNQLIKQNWANTKQQRQQFFRAQKLLRGGKLFILRFFYLKSLLKKIEIVLITSFTMLLNYAVLTLLLDKLLLLIYQYSKDYMA